MHRFVEDAAQLKPTIALEGLAFQASMMGDIWNTLADDECHIIVNCVPVTGKACRAARLG